MEKDQLLNEILEKSKTIAETNTDLTNKIKKNESIVLELNRDIDDLKKKFIGEANLLDNITQLKQETNNISAVNEQLNRNIQLLKQDLATSTEHIRLLKKQLAEKSTLPFKIARKIGKDVVIKLRELEGLKSQMAGITDANNRLNSNMHLLKEDLVNRERHIIILRKQLAKKTTLPLRVARNIRAELESRESELSQLKQKIEKANDSNKELIERLNHLKDDLKKKDDHIMILKRQITKKYEVPFKIARKLSDAVAEKEREISSITKQVEEKRAVIAKLNRIISSLENETAEKSGENKRLRQAEALLKHQLNNLIDANKSLRDVYDGLRQTSVKKERDFANSVETIKLALNELEQKKAELSKLKDRTAEQTEINKQLLQELDTARTGLKNKDSQLLLLKRQLTRKYEVPFKVSSELNTKLTKKEKEIKNTKKQIEEKRAVIEKLNSIVLSLENETAGKTEENKKLKEAETFLKQQINKIIDENKHFAEVSNALKQSAAEKEKDVGRLKKRVSEAEDIVNDLRTTTKALHYTRDIADRANKELISELIQLREDKKKLGKLLIDRDNGIREKDSIVEGMKHELALKTKEAAEEGKKDKNLREETRQLVKVVDDYKKKELELKIKTEFLKKLLEEETRKNLDLRAEIEVLRKSKS